MNLSRIVVHPFLRLPDFLISDQRKITALREESAENPVVILVRAALAGCVRMREVEFCPGLTVDAASFDSLNVHELCSPVAGERPENPSECLAADFSFYAVKDIDYTFPFCVGNLSRNLIAALALSHGEKAFRSFVRPAFYGVQFPMAETFPRLDLCRPFVDAVLRAFGAAVAPC